MGNSCTVCQTDEILIRKIHRGIKTPTRATRLAAGLDLYSPGQYCIMARGKLLIPTGLYVQVPEDCYAEIAPKSGLSYRHFLNVGAGVVDCDYQGEVQVLLQNLGDQPYIVQRDERIAQLIIQKIKRPPVRIVEQFSRPSARGQHGWGSNVFELNQM